MTAADRPPQVDEAAVIEEIRRASGQMLNAGDIMDGPAAGFLLIDILARHGIDYMRPYTGGTR